MMPKGYYRIVPILRSIQKRAFMCLAVPGEIVSLESNGHALVDMSGVRRDISIRLTPGAQIGDYVLIHAGFAIQIIDATEADETLRLIDELTGSDIPYNEPSNGRQP